MEDETVKKPSSRDDSTETSSTDEIIKKPIRKRPSVSKNNEVFFSTEDYYEIRQET